MQRTDLDYVSVVESHPDKRAIDKALRALDDRLFLNPELDPDFNRIVWTVAYRLGGDQPPLLIADWRDPHTRAPLDLSWGLWSRIKQRETREPFKLRDEIKAENEQRRAQIDDERQAQYEALWHDVDPGRWMQAPRRGQYLRRIRDRTRVLR